MHIESVDVERFRRFVDLKIQGIPSSTRLVVLAGPNGTGKSSLFDAFLAWHRPSSQLGFGWDLSYHFRNSGAQGSQLINVTFHEPVPEKPEERKKLFYVRTAYRNDPDFNSRNLSTVEPAVNETRFSRMIESDVTVMMNYQRLTSNAMQDVFERADATMQLGAFRESVISETRDALGRLFPDLRLKTLGNPLQKGSFFFEKGAASDFAYKNLSGGEKAAFDLILDIVVKGKEYTDSIYCIDEPEAHMNTRLQGQLLEELATLMNDRSQMWVATHSIGMMRKAREMEANSPGKVAFIDLGDQDFDNSVVLRPVKPNRRFWEKVLKVALDDLADLVAPASVILCEGNPLGTSTGKNVAHDAICYNTIFAEEFPEALFVSSGNSAQVAADRLGLLNALESVASGTITKRLIDLDDHGHAAVAAYKEQHINTLSRRTIESFLYDDEVLGQLCATLGSSDLAGCIADKQQAIANSVARGNPPDDLKSAAGELFVALRKRLNFTQKGNTAQEFAREALAPLLRPGMKAYNELKTSIFDS